MGGWSGLDIWSWIQSSCTAVYCTSAESTALIGIEQLHKSTICYVLHRMGADCTSWTLVLGSLSLSSHFSSFGITFALSNGTQPLVAQMVKNLPAMQETLIRSLDQGRSPGEGNATHYGLLKWRIPWTEEPGGYHPWGCKELDTTEQLTLSFFFF